MGCEIPIRLSTEEERRKALEEYRNFPFEEIKGKVAEFKAKPPEPMPKRSKLADLLYLGAREIGAYLIGRRTVRGKLADIKELERGNYKVESLSEFEYEKKRKLVLHDGKLEYATMDMVRRWQFQTLWDALGRHGLSFNHVLEIGCGSLHNAKHLTEKIPHYSGFDYSMSRIIVGKMLQKNRYDVWCGDGTAIALEDKSAELSFTMHVLERMGRQSSAMLKEIRRVSDYFACFEPTYEHQNIIGKLHNRKFDYPRNLEDTMADVGMEILERVKIDTGDPFNLPVFILGKCV